MKITFVFLFSFCVSTQCYSQGFKVKDVKMNVTDLSASTCHREDAYGQSCGLVKVLTKTPNIEFGGNVVGAVENKINEYWVYLQRGTSEFMIMRPDYLPMAVKLSDYGIDSIAAKTTYCMTLKEANLNPEKNGVVIHVKPRDAQIIIDNIALKANEDGGYKLLLAKGEHLCSFSAPGYKPLIQMVKTGKELQNIEVELESIWADVYIVSQTNSAEIFVDNESKGTGGWKGKLLPGSYQVRVQQEGCKPYTMVITLIEKDKRTITIPALQSIKGIVRVETAPRGCNVFIDEELKGKTPCTIDDVLYGKHLLRIAIDSCGLKREKEMDFSIESEGVKDIKHVFISNSDFQYYIDAYENFKRGYNLEFPVRTNELNKNTKFYYDKIIENIHHLDSSFFATSVYFPERYDPRIPARCHIGSSIIDLYVRDEPEKVDTIVRMTGSGYYDIAASYKKKEKCDNAIKYYDLYIAQWEKEHTLNEGPTVEFFNYHHALEGIITCMLNRYEKDVVKPYYEKFLSCNPICYDYCTKYSYCSDGTYETIGDVCAQYGDLKEAEKWYKRSLNECEKQINEGYRGWIEPSNRVKRKIEEIRATNRQ